MAGLEGSVTALAERYLLISNNSGGTNTNTAWNENVTFANSLGKYYIMLHSSQNYS